MQCWKCGHETSNMDKICDVCAQAVIPPPVDRKSIIFRAKPGEGYIPLGTAVKFVLMLAAGISVWYWLGIKEPLRYEIAGNEITISSSSSRITYGAQQPLRVFGRVINSDTPKMRLEGGAISSIVFYLTEDEYRQLVNDYTKKGRCPASFLNQHSKALGLVGGSEEGARKLRGISIREGDRVAIEGQSLSFREGTYHGMPLQFSAGKTALMLPSRLKVNESEEILN